MERDLQTMASVDRQTTDRVVRNRRGYITGCIVGLTLCLMGCQSLKDAGIAGTGAAVGAGVATVSSGGVLAPMVGAMVGASAGSVTADLLNRPEEMKEQIVEHVSFFTLLEKLIEVAGFWLILGFIGPLLIGWMMPGPTHFGNGNGNGRSH